MELTYTDGDREEAGILLFFELDLSYGADENDFEAVLPPGLHIPDKALVYVDGTEWGGIVRGRRSSTLDGDEVNAVRGPTWHGVLAESVVEPDASGPYRAGGEANAALAALVERQRLGWLFDVDGSDSGAEVGFEFEPYCGAYAGIRGMLSSAGMKLAVSKEPGSKPSLSAVPAGEYIDERDVGGIEYQLTRDEPPNSMVVLGKEPSEEDAADGKRRPVIRLYADEDGNVSRRQTMEGPDEVQAEPFEVASDDEAEMELRGAERMEELRAKAMTVDLRLPEGRCYGIGDSVGVVDEMTGAVVTAGVTKVVVKYKEGKLSVSNEVGEVTSAAPKGGRRK